MIKRLILTIVVVLISMTEIHSQDSLYLYKDKLIHQVSLEGRPDYILPTNPFFKGNNRKDKPLRFSLSGHLRYAFQYSPNSLMGAIYGNPYQGIGLGWYSFFDKEELGTPLAFYVFQGATLFKPSSRASFDFEWNFGISGGWKYYNAYTNPYNGGVGSPLNAYINLGVALNWKLTNHLSLVTGLSFVHFSNGNTSYPNAGINTAGARVGLTYYINPDTTTPKQENSKLIIPSFNKHISYDLLLFGAWRRRGLMLDGYEISTKSAYPVLGFNFAPMYNFCYRFRAGLSLDGVWDKSANARTEEYVVGQDYIEEVFSFYDAPLREQLSLGMSIRGEYVMPFFSINLGLGYNFLYAHGDRRDYYQILALKIAVSRFAYLNIGYSLYIFQKHNSLMLVIWVRLHNKNRFID